MSFTGRKQPITAFYHIGGEEVERVAEFKDLGLYLDTKLSFKKHFAITYSSAYAMLGFMKRICSNMSNPYALRSVYCAFIRSKLEYACIVWSPFYNVDSNKIESIQKQFVLYALRGLGWSRETFVLPSYVSRCQLINIETLSRRRMNLGIFFVYDLLKGFFDAPELANTLRLNATTRTLRTARIFDLDFHSTNFASNEPINRMCSIFNRVGNIFIESTGRDQFRSVIRGLTNEYFTF